MSAAISQSERPATGPSFRDVLRASLTCGVIVVSRERKVTAISRRAETMTGLPAADVLRKRISILPARLQKIITKTFQTRRAVANRQIVFRSADGEPITLLVNTVVSKGTSRKATEVIVVLNEMTSVNDLEQHARRLDRLASIGIFSASMTHEIRNAFVAVKTFVDLLLKDNPDVDLADIVKREIGRIDSMVGQVLKFSGPGKPAFREIALHETLDHALRLVQHQLDRKNISLARSFAAPADRVRGDDYQLEQAFFNLLFNAVEATGANGRLSVATELMPLRESSHLPSGRTQAQLRVTIADTGFGIQPEHLGRIFEPFFTTKPNGTGLGLPIARRIIQEHQGTIQVESELNKGTTFSIVFPAAKAD